MILVLLVLQKCGTTVLHQMQEVKIRYEVYETEIK